MDNLYIYLNRYLCAVSTYENERKKDILSEVKPFTVMILVSNDKSYIYKYHISLKIFNQKHQCVYLKNVYFSLLWVKQQVAHRPGDKSDCT